MPPHVDAGEQSAAAAATTIAALAPSARRVYPVLPIAAAVLAGLVLLLGLAYVVPRTVSPDRQPAEMRLAILTPAAPDPVSFAISPDGRQVVFVAEDGGRPQLWLRTMNAAEARPLAGTTGASLPFWSPDSQHVGFFANGMLRRIGIGRAPAQSLARAPQPCGGAWTRNDAILFTPDCDGPLVRVPATGGDSERLTAPEEGAEAGHRFPQILPDQNVILFFASGPPGEGAMSVLNLRTGEQRRVVQTDTAAVYAAQGYLLLVRQGMLLAQRFDDGSLEAGEVLSLGDEVGVDATRRVAAISASAAGPIVFRAGAADPLREIALMDRVGRLSSVTEPDTIGAPVASPDGRRVAYSRTVNGNTDIWILDLARQLASRFTFDAASETQPVWSPDGRTLVFHSTRDGFGIYQKAADGSGPEVRISNRGHRETVTSWSPDQRLLLYHHRGSGSSWDVSAMPFDGGGSPMALLQSEFDERGARFSPDGRWIAYEANESGRFEVFVRSFPGETRAQITSEGGRHARWDRDGRTLFYVAPGDALMRVDVRFGSGPSIDADRPRQVLREVRDVPGGAPPYDITPTGFVTSITPDSPDRPLTVLLNWNPRR